MERTLHINDLALLERVATQHAQHDDDYIVCRIEARGNMPDAFNAPTRFAGIGVILLLQGEIIAEVEFKKYIIDAPSVLSINRNIVFKNSGVNDRNSIADCLFISPKFMQDLNLDLSVINLHEMVTNPPEPVIPHLTGPEQETIADYINLLRLNAIHNPDHLFSRNIARSLVQAIFYQLLELRSIRASQLSTTKDSLAQTRQMAYVQEFMRLLQIHHKQERAITFYAAKLCISPKYLSHIIKEATGTAASEWIARFVTLEAKNMLRYSHKNIQQVAYELNFSTQSSFGKYFKHTTGISPTEFLKL